MPDAVSPETDLPSFLEFAGADADPQRFESFTMVMVLEIFLSPENRNSESRSEIGKAAVFGRVAS